MSFTSHPKPRHLSWCIDATKSLQRSIDLIDRGLMPRVLTGTMIVVPCRRVLRGVYGSDWRAVWYLALDAAEGSWNRLQARVHCFWRYRVRLRSPERDLNEIASEDDLASDDDHT